MAKTNKKDVSIEIVQVTKGVMDFYVLGTTPLICNRMSQKVLNQLLLPPKKKNQAEKESSLKHDPMAEFRASPYMDTDPGGATLIQGIAVWFKKAAASVALDLPGATKAGLERLLWAEGERVSIWGVPQMLMSVTRSADINRTPDIRTRAILPQWACKVTLTFVKPVMNEKQVAQLLANAGFMRGVGDWRPQKGSGNFGCFELVSASDPRWKQVVKMGGRKAQEKAMDNPEFYDEETREMFEWFRSEARERGFAA